MWFREWHRLCCSSWTIVVRLSLPTWLFAKKKPWWSWIIDFSCNWLRWSPSRQMLHQVLRYLFGIVKGLKLEALHLLHKKSKGAKTVKFFTFNLLTNHNKSLAKIESSWDTIGEVKSNLARKNFYKQRVQKVS